MRIPMIETRFAHRLSAAIAGSLILAGTVRPTAGTVPAPARSAVARGQAAASGPHASVRHELVLSVDPDTHRLTVTDTITRAPDLAPAPDGTLRFLLHAGLGPVCTTRGASLSRRAGTPDASDFGLPQGRLDLSDRVPVEEYEVRLPAGSRSFVLRYGGPIEHPPEAPAAEYARSFSDTPGTIGPEGVYLSSALRWYPWFGEGLVSFSLDVSLPAGWDAVAQGARTRHEQDRASGRSRIGWREDRPQDGITLSAGRFTEYTRAATSATAMVFLRTPDADLAARYLDATIRYLDTYTKMLGPYPYPKFALVENFWESGLGLPSYTLLGPTVLRLPFIIDTSYPHEILHDWWGNSVFVDEASGNWCEGLTAYQADYRLQEEQGKGPAYRRDALQKYADFVSQAKDFPLVDFRERESPATEAVGYGKAMMLFHMLRRDAGDDAFLAALRRFYASNRFRKASWSDLARAFPATAPSKDRFSAKEMIAEWTSRPGAPRLRLENVVARVAGGSETGWVLEGTVTQIQPDAPWKLDAPVEVEMENLKPTRLHTAHFDGTRRSAPFHLTVPRRPVRVALDPEFDLFRRIEREEIPAALSLAFGADTALAVLPSAEPEEMRKAYRAVAEGWARGKESTFKVVLDSEIESLPADRSVWLFGWQNRFRDAVGAPLAAYDATLDAGALRIGADTLARARHAAALVVPRPGRPDLALAWVASDGAAALPGLGRKLPHYAKYSYLTFEGDDPTNTAKGNWPVVDSPLMVALGPDGRALARAEGAPADESAAAGSGDESPTAESSPGPAALIQSEWISSDRMMDTVRRLSGPELEGRGFGSPGLETAAAQIASAFRDAGLQPGGDTDGSWFQRWRATGGDPAREAELKNAVGILPGAPPEPGGQVIVIGAHYDHLGRGWPDAKAGNAGKIHPGADDNASGVAVLLELARVMAKERSLRTATEPDGSPRASQSPPERTLVFVAFSGEEAGLWGSRHFLTAPGYAPSRCAAMLNFDTVGRLGSGHILLLGAGSAREWKPLLQKIRNRTGTPIEILHDDPGGSDQKTFMNAGVPAIQFFTGAHADYHAPGDTPDKIDAKGLHLITLTAWVLAEELVRPGTVLHASHNDAAPAKPAPTAARKVTLGTVPDFGYEGAGVRLSGVVPGSPAEKAGLVAGDVITKLGSTSIADLRAFSDALKTLNPGDKVQIGFRRGSEERTIQAEVVGR